MFQPLIDWLYGVLTAFYAWLVDLLSYIPKMIWSEILDALASVIQAIPAPDFMLQAQSFFNGIPSSIVYFFQFFAIQEGLAMIITALLMRFLLRRIPFIG